MKIKLFDSTYYIGACDREKQLFENLFPIPSGIRYNSYFIDDEKTAVLDTADESVKREFFENLKSTAENKKIDYLVVHHAEPDHSSAVVELLDLHPETTFVTSETALKFLRNFSGRDFSGRAKVVKEGDVLSLGKNSLVFFAAPMVHWPEVMVSYNAHSKTLFSADAFGSFGATDGSLILSAKNDISSWDDEARRYYSNIVGRFGGNVKTLLKKVAALDVKRICPLHGNVFDGNIEYAVKKYTDWASYSPEENGVLIVYGSMYGNTKRAVDALSALLSERKIKSKMLDVSYTDISYIISECFRFDVLIFACPTYYGQIFPKMEYFLSNYKKTGITGRKIGFLENGTWAAAATKKMKDLLILSDEAYHFENITVNSSPDDFTITKIMKLSDDILKLYKK